MKEKIIKEFRFLLGEEIKKVRKSRKLNQIQLADIIGVDRSTISKIENGKFNISVDYLVKFSLALNHEFKVLDKSFLQNDN